METVPFYSTGVVLNDSIFLQYGGLTGTSLDVQRNAAYLIAEAQMSNHLGTFLYPEVVSGTIPFSDVARVVSTEKGYVHRILNMRVLSAAKTELWTISGSHAYSWIGDDTFGYLHYRDFNQHYYGCGPTGTPAYLEYVYEAGLPSGTINQPAALLALTMAAQISLNEMVYPFSNESTGDVGVTEFRSLQYSEKRKPWKNTAFGQSPKAAKIAQLVDNTIRKANKVFSLR